MKIKTKRLEIAVRDSTKIPQQAKGGNNMKIIKVLKSLNEIQAYVKVSKDCKIFDTHYAALQLVREKHNDRNINATQLLDIEHNEKMQAGIPVYTL